MLPDKNEMVKFIQSLMVFYKAQVKSSEDGPTKAHSIPMQSMVNKSVFYEFVLTSNMNKTVTNVIINVCYQSNNNMQRLEMVYANGYETEGNWLKDIMMIIMCQRERIGEARKKKLKDIMLMHKFIEEPYVLDEELIKEIHLSLST